MERKGETKKRKGEKKKSNNIVKKKEIFKNTCIHHNYKQF